MLFDSVTFKKSYVLLIVLQSPIFGLAADIKPVKSPAEYPYQVTQNHFWQAV